MKRIEFIFIIFLLFVVSANAQKKQITILHTNDTHSQIEDFNDKEFADKGNVGGVLWRYSFIEQERAKDSSILLLDAGDFSQGTPYFNVFEGFAEIELMNRMGYEFTTLGNHEFDNGINNLTERLKKADFQVLCANYKFKNKALNKLIKPYEIIERNGLRIGIFGLTTNLEGLTSLEVLQNIEYIDAIETAKKMVAILKIENCDLIICLSHLGYDKEKPTQTDFDISVAEAVAGIDLIVGGHTHTKMPEPSIINGVRILQANEKGCFVGKMTIEF